MNINIKTAIVNDSTACIPDSIQAKLPIHVVAYYIHRGVEVLRDLVTVERKDFLDWLPTATELPKTASPGPGDYLELYKDLANNVDDQTVKIDYLLIDQSDMVVVRYPEEKLPGYENRSDGLYIPLSVGVICEMVHGHYSGKRIYALWLPEKEPSPFFSYYCKKYFRQEKELTQYLNEYVW